MAMTEINTSLKYLMKTFACCHTVWYDSAFLYQSNKLSGVYSCWGKYYNCLDVYQLTVYVYPCF